jgi:hypothetical protein
MGVNHSRGTPFSINSHPFPLPLTCKVRQTTSTHRKGSWDEIIFSKEELQVFKLHHFLLSAGKLVMTSITVLPPGRFSKCIIKHN